MLRICYLASPLSPLEGETLAGNVERSKRWRTWLTKQEPTSIFLAPYIEAIDAGADDNEPATRAAGLERMCELVARCHAIYLVGGRISPGMRDERRAALLADIDEVDLTHLGPEPPAARDQRERMSGRQREVYDFLRHYTVETLGDDPHDACTHAVCSLCGWEGTWPPRDADIIMRQPIAALSPAPAERAPGPACRVYVNATASEITASCGCGTAEPVTLRMGAPGTGTRCTCRPDADGRHHMGCRKAGTGKEQAPAADVWQQVADIADSHFQAAIGHANVGAWDWFTGLIQALREAGAPTKTPDHHPPREAGATPPKEPTSNG